MRERLPIFHFWFLPVAVVVTFAGLFLPKWEPLVVIRLTPPADLPFAGATPFIVPGIDNPPTVPASRADLPDEELVIGVRSGDKSRAYVLRAFRNLSGHVVNDIVGGRPISVTHCDRTECTCVFTTSTQNTVLDLATGGWDGQQMLLKVGSVFYPQGAKLPSVGPAPDFPYAAEPFVLVSWKQWRTKYPDTDVYLGNDKTPNADEPR